MQDAGRTGCECGIQDAHNACSDTLEYTGKSWQQHNSKSSSTQRTNRELPKEQVQQVLSKVNPWPGQFQACTARITSNVILCNSPNIVNDWSLKSFWLLNT